MDQSTHCPQPEPSPATGPIGTAEIGQLPFAAMLWQLHQEKQSLLIHAAGGSIFLEDGEIIHACAGELEGAPALAQMFSQRTPTVRTAPLTASPRSISEPLRCVLDRAMSLVTGSVPLPVPGAEPEAAPGDRARRDTPPIERLRSVSYASMSLPEVPGTPTMVTQATASGLATEETSSQSYIVGSGDGQPPPVVLRPSAWPRGPGATLVPVMLSVLATLGITLGLLYLVWPADELSTVTVDQPTLTMGAQRVAPSATLAASAWEQPTHKRTVLVRTKPEGLLLVDALSGKPVGVSPLEVELGGNRLTWKLAAEIGGHVSPGLALPEAGTLASFDLTSWAATLQPQVDEQAVARARRARARRRARHRTSRTDQDAKPAVAGTQGGAADTTPALGLVDDFDLPNLGTVD